jgi:Fe-S-cluster containining protein
MKNIENNENPSVCAKCGGKCCKHYGGLFHPEDFETITEEALIKVIDNGGVSIDWLEPDEDEGYYDRVYFLRMRHVDASIIDPAFMGQCVHLTPTGCDLSFDQRAYGCKSLQVDDNMKCSKGCYDKYMAAADWMPYQDIMKKLMNHYRNQEAEFFKKQMIDALKAMGLNIDV